MRSKPEPNPTAKAKQGWSYIGVISRLSQIQVSRFHTSSEYINANSWEDWNNMCHFIITITGLTSINGSDKSVWGLDLDNIWNWSNIQLGSHSGKQVL